MKKLISTAVLALALLPAAQARDTVLHISLADVLAMPDAQGKLSGKVKFHLAGAEPLKVEKLMFSDFTNQKTNGMGKSDEFGCRWAILSGLIALEKKAQQVGADAVVDIVSYYKKNETRSPQTIECHAGAFVVGAAMKGSYAKLAN